MSSAPTVSVPIFFILGRPRSGTTLLRTLFDAHPHVQIPPEFPVFLLMARRFREVSIWDEEARRSFVDQVFRYPRFGQRSLEQLKVDREVLLRDILELPGPVTLGDLLKQFNLHTFSAFRKDEIRLAGDKNPIYSVFVPVLMKLFPDARFIGLVRDYRSTFHSLKSLPGTPVEAPVLSLQIARWRYVYKRFLVYQRRYPERFRLVRYEDLVREPVMYMKELCEFLGIPYDESVFSYHQYPDGIRETFSSAAVEKFHRSLLQPVNTGRIQLWESALSEAEVKTADLLAGRYAGRFDYPKKYSGFYPWIWLKTRPMVMYAWLLFTLMRSVNHLPYGITRWLSGKLVRLVKIYSLFSRKKDPAQEKV